jgi:hypothetical protein
MGFAVACRQPLPGKYHVRAVKEGNISEVEGEDLADTISTAKKMLTKKEKSNAGTHQKG